MNTYKLVYIVLRNKNDVSFVTTTEPCKCRVKIVENIYEKEKSKLTLYGK
jgi:hypothetical protein